MTVAGLTAAVEAASLESRPSFYVAEIVRAPEGVLVLRTETPVRILRTETPVRSSARRADQES